MITEDCTNYSIEKCKQDPKSLEIVIDEVVSPKTSQCESQDSQQVYSLKPSILTPRRTSRMSVRDRLHHPPVSRAMPHRISIWSRATHQRAHEKDIREIKKEGWVRREARQTVKSSYLQDRGALTKWTRRRTRSSAPGETSGSQGSKISVQQRTLLQVTGVQNVLSHQYAAWLWPKLASRTFEFASCFEFHIKTSMIENRNPILIFWTVIKAVCDSSWILEGAAMWLLQYFMQEFLAATLCSLPALEPARFARNTMVRMSVLDRPCRELSTFRRYTRPKMWSRKMSDETVTLSGAMYSNCWFRADIIRQGHPEWKCVPRVSTEVYICWSCDRVCTGQHACALEQNQQVTLLQLVWYTDTLCKLTEAQLSASTASKSERQRIGRKGSHRDTVAFLTTRSQTGRLNQDESVSDSSMDSLKCTHGAINCSVCVSREHLVNNAPSPKTIWRLRNSDKRPSMGMSVTRLNKNRRFAVGVQKFKSGGEQRSIRDRRKRKLRRTETDGQYSQEDCNSVWSAGGKGLDEAIRASSDNLLKKTEAWRDVYGQ